MSVYSDRKTAISSVAVSLALHAVILSVFTVINFSSKQSSARGVNTATVQIKSVSRLAEKVQILPKPRICLPAGRTGGNPDFVLNETQKPVFGTSGQSLNVQLLSLENLTAYPAGNRTIRFFENAISEKRLCFVVDCSGSMQGIFEKVRLQLKNSIRSLEPDRYFQVIFFGDNQLYCFGGNNLVRASNPVKQKAVEFIDNIKPQGRTNAVEAIRSAMQNRDPAVNSPDVIYFLTDGFNLAENNDNLLMSILNFRDSYCNKTIINTIGFWPKPQDAFILRQLARQTGGIFTLINK